LAGDFGEVDTVGPEEAMAGMFQIVLVDGVVDDPLLVAFIIADFQWQ
jgi:hypothetical protein